MIIFCSEKTFRKRDKKWLPVADYIIIDGDDAGNYGKKSKNTIADDYANTVTMGALCPGGKLLRVVTNDADEDDISPNKIDSMIDNYLTDKSVTAALVGIAKGLIFDSNGVVGESNIFVVLPKKVYKAFSKMLMDRLKEILKDIDFKFIYDEDDIEDDRSILTQPLKKKKIKELTEAIKKAEKKYKLNK